MSSSAPEARDDVFRLFTEGWTLADDIVGESVELRYQGVLFGPGGTALPPIDPGRYWARLSMRNVMSRQSAFVIDQVEGESPIVFESNGLLFVQVFAPMSAVDGFAKGLLLAKLAQAIFRAAETPSGVIFRNVRISELEDDTKSYRWNVIAEYEFDEIG